MEVTEEPWDARLSETHVTYSESRARERQPFVGPAPISVPPPGAATAGNARHVGGMRKRQGRPHQVGFCRAPVGLECV